uniref:Putative ovule protein n=1 Tax=Solanum chacoense TaxID=4108 RepID=A0A0V0HEK6_SOLCH
MTWISPANTFGSREFFALETLFKSHPKGCLIILSRTLDTPRGVTILNPLTELAYNVVSVTPELSFLFNRTPVETWYTDLKKGNKDPGEIPLAQNLSNLIRLAVLYKYGGVYLDTDFIILKDFSSLRNSIGAQSVSANGNWTRLNNAVLIFDRKHPLLYKFMEEFALSFDGNKWGQNGPYLVSRVVTMMSTEKYQLNFTVLPPISFYPDEIKYKNSFKMDRCKIVTT